MNQQTIIDNFKTARKRLIATSYKALTDQAAYHHLRDRSKRWNQAINNAHAVGQQVNLSYTANLTDDINRFLSIKGKAAK